MHILYAQLNRWSIEFADFIEILELQGIGIEKIVANYGKTSNAKATVSWNKYYLHYYLDICVAVGNTKKEMWEKFYIEE